MFALLLGLALAAEPHPTPLPGWVAERVPIAVAGPQPVPHTAALDDLGRLVIGTSHGLVLWDGRTFTHIGPDMPGGPAAEHAWHVAPAQGGGVWVITETGSVQRRRGDTVEDFGALVADAPTVGVSVIDGTPLVETSAGVWELTDAPHLRTDLPPDARALHASGGALRWRTATGPFELPSPGAPLVALDAASGEASWEAAGAALRACGPITSDSDRTLWIGGTPLFHPPIEVATAVGVGDDCVFLLEEGALLVLRRSPLRVRPSPGPTPYVERVVRDEGDGQLWALSFVHATAWPVAAPERAYSTFVVPGRAPDTLSHTSLLPFTLPTGRVWSTGAGFFPEVTGGPADQLTLGPALAPSCPEASAAHLALSDGGFLTVCATWRPGAGWSATPQQGTGPYQEARAMAQRSDGSLLIGGPRGLGLAAGPDAPAAFVPTPEGARPRHLRVEGGRVWMATERLGLCAAAEADVEAGVWRCAGAAQGLPANQVHASFADARGRVWVSTDYGLALLDAAELDAVLAGDAEDLGVLLFGEADGLAPPELNGFHGDGGVASPDGHLSFAGFAGLVEVAPDQLVLPSQVEVAVEGLPEGALPADHPPLTLRFVTRPITWSPRVRLRYRLDDDAWADTGPELVLQRLPAGAHTLQVEARLLGPWQPAGSFPLTRTRAFTEGAGFYLLAGLAALGVGLVAALARNRALAARQAELAALVAQQTAELVARNEAIATQAAQLEANNRLIASQIARLREVDELKRRFIADLAHELRTPLTLLLGALDAPQAGGLAGARGNARRLHALVEELFDLSRLEAGKLRLRARRVDLAEAATAAAARFTDAFRAARRTLDVQVTPVTVWVDPGLLDKILANLLGNALKHGEGRVTLRVRADADAVVEVQDEGPGVAPADRERAFERFVQLSIGDTRAKEGAGLGLSLVRELSELHGGQAEILDHARFCVHFPLGQAHLQLDDIDPTPPATRSGAERAEVPPDATSTDILLVEDHDEMRAFIQSLLASRWTVTGVKNGREALEAVAVHRPRLIVSDVRMPVLDGFGMATALRADPATAGLPLVFVSAKAQPEDVAEGLTLAQAYLTKPFAAEDLLTAVTRWIGPAPQRPAHEVAWLTGLEATADAHLADPEFGVATLAQRSAMSIRSLQQRMKELDLPPPAAWLLERRLHVAREHLRLGTFATVSEVAAAVGLSRSYFTRAYKAWSGRSPGDEG